MQIYLDGLRYLARRKVFPGPFNSQDWASVAPAIRQRAFFSSTINSARVLHRMRSMLLDWQSGAVETILTPSGATETAFKESGLAKFREKASELLISEGLATPADFKNESIRNVVSASRLKLIFNTNTAQAQDFAIYQSRVADPVRINRFPAAEFVRTPGARVPRTLHVANEGAVRRYDDFAFWLAQNSTDIGGFGVPWGPWGFNSFMTTFPVSRARAEKLGLVKPGEKVMPPDLTQFGVTLPARLNKGVTADVDDITPEIKQQAINTITSRLGPQAVRPDGKLTLEALQALRGGGALPPAAAPVPVPVPVVAPPKQIGSDVSSKITTSGKLRAGLEEQFNKVLRIIDSIHGDGPLQNIELLDEFSTRTTRNGAYSPYGKYIEINKSKTVVDTMTHEIGHWLDHHGFWSGDPDRVIADAIYDNKWGSGSPEFEGFIKAAKSSRKIQEIKADRRLKPSSRKYFIQNDEMFARAYFQYIAVESNESELMAALRGRQTAGVRGLKYPDQWDDDDFEPIRQEITKILKARKWLRTPTR